MYVTAKEPRMYLFLERSNQVRLDKLPIAGLIFAILLSEAFNALFLENKVRQIAKKG